MIAGRLRVRSRKDGWSNAVLVREKKFYMTFIKLSLTIALQNLLAYGLNLADNLMLGRYNEISLAAASLVGQIQYLLQMISIAGIGAGALVMVSQYWGKGELEPIRDIISLAMKFAAVTGLVFFSIAFFMPQTVLRFLTSDSAMRAEGVKYLRILSFSFLTFPLQSALVMSIRGVRIVNIGPIVSIASLSLNILLNYVFIFGNWGAPEMGISGSAWATLIARVLELIIVLVYVRFFDKKLQLRLLTFFRLCTRYLSDFSRTVIPVILSGASWGIGSMMQIVILGHISGGVVAANSIAATVYQVITVFAFGASSTSNVMIGNAIGAGKMSDIRPYTRTLQILFVVNGLITGLILFCIRDLILSFYVLDTQTRELARTFMTLLSVVVVFASYEYPAESGIILGGGNTRYAFIIDTVFIWLVVIPFSALSAFVWKLSPVITFLFLKSDQFLKCIPNGIVLNRYRWIRVLTHNKEAQAPPQINQIAKK